MHAKPSAERVRVPGRELRLDEKILKTRHGERGSAERGIAVCVGSLRAWTRGRRLEIRVRDVARDRRENHAGNSVAEGVDRAHGAKKRRSRAQRKIRVERRETGD